MHPASDGQPPIVLSIIKIRSLGLVAIHEWKKFGSAVANSFAVVSVKVFMFSPIRTKFPGSTLKCAGLPQKAYRCPRARHPSVSRYQSGKSACLASGLCGLADRIL